MRKWGMFMAVLVLVAGLAAGCGDGKTETDASASAGGSPSAEANGEGNDGKGTPVKLTFWGGVPAEAGPQAVIDAWNQAHPDIQVEYVRFVNDDDGNLKLDTALTTGQSVDLYVNYTVTRLERRVEAGVALDLSQIGDYNIDEKMGPAAKEWLVDGKYYALPTKANKFFFWLNKDALDEAGLPVPTDWTWEDVKRYAEKLGKEGRYGLVRHLEPFPDPWDGSVVSQGYVKADGTSNLDNPYVRKWLEILKSMMDAGTTPPLGEQITTKLPEDATFLKGEAAMLDAGEWIFRSSNNLKDFPRDFKIAFAPVPKVSGDQTDFKVRGGLGDAISINPHSPHIKEAWEFLKWYADGGMIPMAAGGRLPASKDADLDAAIKALLGEHADTYDEASLKAVVFGKYDTYTRNIPQQVMDLRQEEYEKYFLGAQSLDETMQRVVERHNQYLRQNQ